MQRDFFIGAGFALLLFAVGSAAGYFASRPDGCYSLTDYASLSAGMNLPTNLKGDLK
jgi:hypothetical protein